MVGRNVQQSWNEESAADSRPALVVLRVSGSLGVLVQHLVGLEGSKVGRGLLDAPENWQEKREFVIYLAVLEIQPVTDHHHPDHHHPDHHRCDEEYDNARIFHPLAVLETWSSSLHYGLSNGNREFQNL